MNKLTIRDVDIAGKRVFVRVDFNVPIDEKTGVITDDGRIRAALPTLKYLLEKKTKIILCSHLGRPDGKVVESQRLTGVAKRLSDIVDQPVDMAGDCVGPDVEQCVANMKPGQILMLENVRFHQEEEDGEPSFAQALSRLGTSTLTMRLLFLTDVTLLSLVSLIIFLRSPVCYWKKNWIHWAG